MHYVLNCTQEIQLNVHMLLHQQNVTGYKKLETFTPLKHNTNLMLQYYQELDNNRAFLYESRCEYRNYIV